MNTLKSFETLHLKLHFFENIKICQCLPIFLEYFRIIIILKMAVKNLYYPLQKTVVPQNILISPPNIENK